MIAEKRRPNETPEAWLARNLVEVEERIRVGRRNLRVLMVFAVISSGIWIWWALR